MLEVSDLHVGYGQSEVIHNATFNVQKAEILAIMGRNGMGKTTLLKSLIGLIGAKSGINQGGWRRGVRTCRPIGACAAGWPMCPRAA